MRQVVVGDRAGAAAGAVSTHGANTTRFASLLRAASAALVRSVGTVDLHVVVAVRGVVVQVEPAEGSARAGELHDQHQVNLVGLWRRRYVRAVRALPLGPQNSSCQVAWRRIPWRVANPPPCSRFSTV